MPTLAPMCTVFPFEPDGVFEKLFQSPGHAHCVSAIHRFFQHHRKLIAAGAGHRVGASNPTQEKLPYVFEQLVADMMPHGVVDLLKAVQIDQQESGLRASAPRALEGILQSILKEPPVRQSSELVMQGEIFVVLNLVLEQDQNHAYGNHVLGQVPNLTLEMEAREERAKGRSDRKDVRPSQETQDGDESPRRSAPVGIPEMNAAAKVDGEENRVQSQVKAIAGAYSAPSEERRKGTRKEAPMSSEADG